MANRWHSLHWCSGSVDLKACVLSPKCLQTTNPKESRALGALAPAALLLSPRAAATPKRESLVQLKENPRNYGHGAALVTSLGVGRPDSWFSREWLSSCGEHILSLGLLPREETRKLEHVFWQRVSTLNISIPGES